MSDTKKIGARIVLDGEAEFRQSINNSKAALKQFDSELKLTAEEFKDNEKSMERLQKVQATYQKQQATLQKQEKAYSEQLEKGNKAHEEATQIHEKTAKSVEQLRKKLEDAKRVYGEDSEEVKKLSQELDKAEDSYKREEKAITGLETKMIKWETSLNETRTELAKTDKALDEVNHNIDNYDDYIKEAGEETAKANPEIAKLGVSMGQLVGAELIAEGIKKMARACVDLAKASIDVGMQFEASMSNVEALSGASGEALDSLKEKAREMGASTIYSASQAADAMGYMALAGWDAKQMIEGIEPVLNLAAAADMDLAQASDIVTDYMTAFGLEAQDASHFTDMLASAMSASNTTVEMLGESFKNVSATAHQMGIEAEDVTAVLAAMANAGVKGGEAGTALNTILVRLATNTKGAADTLKGYGIDVYDPVSHNMNNLTDILEGLEHVWVDLTQEEQNNLAKIIAGTNQYSKFATIMQGVSQQAQEGGKSFYDYAEALRNCDGAAKSMADTMQDNLKGKLTILDSSLQALGESMYDVFDEELKKGVEGATDAVTRLNNAVKNGDMNVSLEKMSKSLGKLIDKVVDWTEENLPKMIDGLTKIIDNADKIGAAIKGIVAGLIAFKVASSVVAIASAGMAVYRAATEAATVAQWAMNAAADANPYVLLASVLVGAAVAMGSYAMAVMDSAGAMGESAEASQKLLDSTRETNEAFAQSREERAKAREEFEAESVVVKNLADRLLELNGKASLTASEQAEMASAIEQLNSAYPELNLQVDEYGRLTRESTEALENNLDAMIRQAKVAALQDDLVKIARNQVEAQKDLLKTNKELEEQQKKYNKAYSDWSRINKQATEEIEQFGQMTDATALALSEAKQKLDDEAIGLANLQNAAFETKGEIDEFGKEYEETFGLIGDTTATDAAAEGIEEVGNAAEVTAGQLRVMSEEFQKEVEDLQKSVEQTLSSSNDIFNEAKKIEDQNIGDMKTHIQDHIDQLEGWGDSYKELAGKVDDSTGLVLQYIANMGVEGKGYIDAMLELDPNELKDFTDSMVKALSLPSELAGQVADEYTQAVQDSIDGATKVVKDANADGSEIKQEEEKFAKGLVDEMDKAMGTEGELVGEKAKKAVDATETAITEGTEPVRVASEGMANAIVEPIETTVTYDAFYAIGQSVGEGLAAGIRAGIEEVAAAAEELAAAAEAASKDHLQINSPSKVFMRIGDSIGEGLEKGIDRSMKGVVNTLNNTLPNEKNVKVGSIASSSDISQNNINQLANMLSQYLPQLATNTNVNVSLEGDAKGIFRVVKQENTRIIKSTGFRPLLT